MTNTLINDDERNDLLSFYSDAHKDAYGYRPRDWATIMLKSTDELRSDINQFQFESNLQEECERDREEQAKQRWTAHIEGIMRDNGVNRATALRWDMEAMDASDDVGFYCYLWSLNYTLEPSIRSDLKACG